jgi:CBS domain-containing protein
VATLLVVAVVVGGAVSSASASSASHATVTTVVSGLDNPRDLVFSHGRLYVAEAGHGGTAACFSDPEAGKACIGFTSKISRIDVARGRVHRVARGLVSIASPDGSGATGVDGISASDGRLVGIITGSALSIPSGLLPAAVEARVKHQLGRVVVLSDDGRRFAGDVGDRDYVWSGNHPNLVPGQFPDANPYGILAAGRSSWVVDAGSNTLDRVNANGHVRVVRFIPNPPASDAVPTCIDRGPDGALYIGELTGGGNAPGSSTVWRYDPRHKRLTKWATGLTAVTGCGFGKHGRFYATEFSTGGLDQAAPGTGAVVLVPAHSTKPTTIVGGLNFPGGFAAGRDGSLYVSDWSIAPSNTGGGPTGSVIRISLHS